MIVLQAALNINKATVRRDRPVDPIKNPRVGVQAGHWCH